MQRIFIATLLGLSICILSSCFTINDHIVFNRDGSGSVKTTVDMSSMMQMLGMFLPDSLKEDMQLDNILNSDLSQYKKIAGISNAKIASDKEYSYTVSYNFSNIKALNQAVALNEKDSNIPAGFGEMMKTQYSFKKGKISRNTSIDPSHLETEGINIAESKEMFQFMNSPTYNVTYQLPKNVKKIDLKNEKSTAVKDKNTVSISYNLLDFLEAKGEVMNHNIKF
ncbi:MAG: hypothetical protein IPL33_15425 [Sphingobacteriales bacterium]|jgi:hypothetical protein|nr:hypothetical protein [Sphingobacteriales bacterium]MCC7223853.1 hypothetical protein [Chitinophagales bacterium]